MPSIFSRSNASKKEGEETPSGFARRPVASYNPSRGDTQLRQADPASSTSYTRNHNYTSNGPHQTPSRAAPSGLMDSSSSLQQKHPPLQEDQTPLRMENSRLSELPWDNQRQVSALPSQSRVSESQASRQTRVLEDFLCKMYEPNLQEYDKLRQYAHGKIENILKSRNILAKVDSRVKTLDSLKRKLYKRDEEKPYLDREDIDRDQLDFVGLRICLYFPDQKWDVIRALKDDFDWDSDRVFEREWKSDKPQVYEKRFGEYAADHIWLRLKSSDQKSSVLQKKLISLVSSQRFEIQMRSVLMDAWSGISHDLEYKLLTGVLSGAELKLLDTIKGQVEAAELMLDILHQAHLKRLAKDQRNISSLGEIEEIVADFLPRDVSNEFKGSSQLVLDLSRLLGAHTPALLRELLLKSDIRGDFDGQFLQWQHYSDPLRPKVSFYIVRKILQQLPEEDYVALIDKSERASKRLRSHDNSYLSHSLAQTILWLYAGMSGSPEASFESLPTWQVEKCAALWCFYILAKVHRQRNLGWLPRRLLTMIDSPPTGIDLATELSFLSLLDQVPPLDLKNRHETRDNKSSQREASSTINPRHHLNEHLVCCEFAEKLRHSHPKAWQRGFLTVLLALPDLNRQALADGGGSLPKVAGDHLLFADWLLKNRRIDLLQSCIDICFDSSQRGGSRILELLSQLPTVHPHLQFDPSIFAPEQQYNDKQRGKGDARWKTDLMSRKETLSYVAVIETPYT